MQCNVIQCRGMHWHSWVCIGIHGYVLVQYTFIWYVLVCIGIKWYDWHGLVCVGMCNVVVCIGICWLTGCLKPFSPTAIALGPSAIVKVSGQNSFRTL